MILFIIIFLVFLRFVILITLYILTMPLTHETRCCLFRIVKHLHTPCGLCISLEFHSLTAQTKRKYQADLSVAIRKTEWVTIETMRERLGA